MADEIVKVTRLYEFVGTRAAVEEQIRRSIHGTRLVGKGFSSNGPVAITAVTIGEFPQMAESREQALVAQINTLEALVEDKMAEIQTLQETTGVND